MMISSLCKLMKAFASQFHLESLVQNIGRKYPWTQYNPKKLKQQDYAEKPPKKVLASLENLFKLL